MTTFRRLFGLMAGHRRWIAVGALLGFLAVGSNVALMAMSAYLISKAAIVTNVAEVALAITAVRVLAISRAAFRYLERYVTHRATFAILADLRVWFFAVDRAARAGRPGDPSERRPAGADRRRHRDARGLLRPDHRPAGRGRPGDRVRERSCSAPSTRSSAWPCVVFLVADRDRPAARLAPAVEAAGGSRSSRLVPS